MRTILTTIFASLLFSCSQTDSEKYAFNTLSAFRTGLNFVNDPQLTNELNVFNYMYFYNGAGIAAGDFNLDGLPDLYFIANQTANKLFLNQGDLTFLEVTEQTGLAGNCDWSTGVSIVDINQDGLLDIYVSCVGDYLDLQGSNQLFICQEVINGIPYYSEQASEYGLEAAGFATQTTFFDYDLDGDLDCFMLNHSLHQNGTFGRRSSFQNKESHGAGDRLQRNDKGHFVDVTNSSGILSTVIGYGLGVAIGDLNNDRWPDIYVTNDFHENDYLYINKQDGGFVEVATERMRHTSRFSMGVDIGDINNDGNLDIFTLDMLPSDRTILKSSLGEDGFDIYQFKLGHGYQDQFARNSLQLSNGDDTYSEIAQMANVSATDWSWCPLFIDFENDGDQDLFISNGIPRRMNDIDYINFQLGNDDIQYKLENNLITEDELRLIQKMPQIKLPNVFFINYDPYQFNNISSAIKDQPLTFSMGAVTADLDLDGDLDIVTNNIADKPHIYENIIANPAKSNYLHLVFSGPKGNKHGIGTKIEINYLNGQKVIREYYPNRGYLSGSHTGLFIGIGDKSKVQSAFIYWPGQDPIEFKPKFNSLDSLLFQDDQVENAKLPASELSLHFENVSDRSNLNFHHDENPFIEFNREPLMPHMVSREGPALAGGDIDGDGDVDLFFGNAKRRPSKIHRQVDPGVWEHFAAPALAQDSIFEDVDALFCDYDLDGDQDLFVAAGGNEYKGNSEALSQRAYTNDGLGNFTRADLFPEIHLTASCIVAIHANQDKYPDIFIGARAVTSSYGMIPQSHLFINNKNGTFTNATSMLPQNGKIGFVRDAVVADLNLDGREDLLLATSWSQPLLLQNQDTGFESQPIGMEKGLWNTLYPIDLDLDGDLDLLAGNSGLNTRFKPTDAEPLVMYVNDFDDNGEREQILTYFVQGKETIFPNHAELIKRLPALRKKYQFAKDFAKADIGEVLGKTKIKQSDRFEITNLASGYFLNHDEYFEFVPFPLQIQIAPIWNITLLDTDRDGSRFLMTGNFHENTIEMGKYDASYGEILEITHDLKMQTSRTGVPIMGQVREVLAINSYLIIARNNDGVVVLKSKP